MAKNPVKILVVDDDQMNIAILENILRRDFELKSVSNGQEALEAVQHFPCDIVLLDIMMPGMDGYEVCRRLKSDDRFRFTKILLVSAKAMLDDRLKGYESGADDYITKPFDENEILAKVKVFRGLRYAEESDLIKRNFMALFSHETRTPLNSIMGYAKLLRSNPALSHEECGYIEKIIQSGNALVELAGKVQLLCDLKENKAVLCTLVCSLEDFINGILRRIYSKRNGEGARIIFDNRITGQVRLDPFFMEQALVVVMDNALKFSPRDREVVIATEILNGGFSIRVTDQGEGIADDLKEKIFDEFAVRDIMSHQKWKGLSLALARSIAERHGGSLVVESPEKGGAAFIFRLPVR